MDLAAFEPDPFEPPSPWRVPEDAPPAYSDLRAQRLEYTSRGDRVPGRLWLPPGAGPFPLVLLQHGAHGSKDADYVLQVAAPWIRGGAAVAAIDLPLHGERASAKLGAVLLAELGLAEGRVPGGPAVRREFTRQAVIDLRRAVDVLAALPEIDGARIGYAGLSLGSVVGAVFCGVDARPRAAALALGGGGFPDPAIDPVTHIGRFAPRPLLFVNMRADATVPREASEALHAAAGEPKEVLWFDGGHRELPGRGLKAMWQLLRKELGL